MEIEEELGKRVGRTTAVVTGREEHIHSDGIFDKVSKQKLHILMGKMSYNSSVYVCFKWMNRFPNN